MRGRVEGRREIYKTRTYLWLVIKQPSHSNPLFIPPTQRISPLPHTVPSAFSFDHMPHLYHFQDLEEVGIGDAALEHLGVRVGVDQLIPQSASAEVWPLRDVGELRGGGFVDCSTWVSAFTIFTLYAGFSRVGQHSRIRASMEGKTSAEA